ncbi:hypothetical protein [Streptomyces sp. RLA2-12]|uniref:hypothetical protein n=1 Tax=Streptomyces sp. RLA2-12 TaxID=2721242 RepID=UPI002006ECB4|nr:hypothetical protein [Streptomyces sp. RLA2-12]
MNNGTSSKLGPRTTPPAQPPVRAGMGRRITGGAIGAGASVTALTMAGAPWWAVAIAVVVGIAVPGLLALAQTLIPDESEHKRDVLLAWMRHRERRARSRVPAQRRRTARSRQ